MDSLSADHTASEEGAVATHLRELDVDLITRGHLERGLEALQNEFVGTFSPETVERYMAESLVPKPMTDEVVEAADAVITMGCGDACPIYPGKRYEDWEVDDPAEADLDGVRRIRDDIAGRVRHLLAELAPARSAPR
jgi:low molecular weight phosphotyrosine protein phosphatase